ncbi:MAG: hypothetical protein Kow0074_25170 [Candidatus Zixiibacteriota bacterium]
MRSSTLRIAVLALFLFGAALGYSYTVATDVAQAAENCSCYRQFDCPVTCVKGGIWDPVLEVCTDAASGPCAICKCY